MAYNRARFLNIFHEDDMSRATRISLSLIGFLFCTVIVVINYNTMVTLFALIASCALIFSFIFWTDGLYTGYLEVLNSDVEIARINIKRLIRTANETIKIHSATLSPAIYCVP